MNVQRGDIVLLDYPYPSGGATKVRPALVVQTIMTIVVWSIRSLCRYQCDPKGT